MCVWAASVTVCPPSHCPSLTFSSSSNVNEEAFKVDLKRVVCFGGFFLHKMQSNCVGHFS